MRVHDAPPVDEPPPYPPDPVIDAYKSGIDVTLIVENLRRTPEERLANLAALQRFVSRFRGAAALDSASR
jgi:hypothetical protein